MIPFVAPSWLLTGWKFLRAIPAIVYVGLLAVVFAVSSAHYRDQRNEARAEHAAHLQADADAMAKAKAQAKAAEKAQKQAMADAAAKYEKDKADAIAKKDRVIADLHSGALRLQKRWRGCESRPGAASGPEAGDDAADLRETGAGDLVRVAANADAEVNYLQGLIRSAPTCFTVGK